MKNKLSVITRSLSALGALSTLSTLSTLMMASASVHAQSTAAPAAPAAAPSYTLTGNMALLSDYRFRGISQTWNLPTVQAGLDYAHASGIYLGAWGSNVSGNSYNNGAGLELDLYGGYKLPLSSELTLDLGALTYNYPGARLNSAPGVAGGTKYNNIDLYVGLSAGAFSAKLSVATTDYFGLNSDTAGYAYFKSLSAKGGSQGSSYLDLNYSTDLGDGLSLGTHLGYLSVRHYSELSYTDVKLSLSKDWSGLSWSAALVGSNADKAYYQVADASGANPKRVAKTGLLLSVGKSF